MTQNVVLAVNTSAAASLPVYFSITGVAAAAVVASSRPLTAAQLFSPYFTKNGVGSTVSIAVLTLASISAMYCWCRVTSSRVPSRPMCPPMKCFHG
jgi:hypothetical protein